MKKLQKIFESRDHLKRYVLALAPWAEGEISETIGGFEEAEKKLNNIDASGYAKTRNFGNGKVTRLSPYIHHGVLSLNEIRNYVLSQHTQPEEITKFIQELAWRDFWQRVAQQNPGWIWNDVEPYKTGYTAHEYSDSLPKDILEANTGVACIDAFIHDLTDTGYVHNHARMYLASYIVHFRKVKWQTGARWFLKHLLDGDEASNNLSWQWIASTFSSKPYIFNLQNVTTYFGNFVDTSSKNNKILDATYETLSNYLFPNLEAPHG
jgi:deoxyribodipyrimidine photo-lyase